MLSSKAKRELKIDQRQILIDSIEIGIASPQQIYLRGSRQLPNGKKVGLIKNSKTVNYKRFTPFRDGLFCERIFGPVTSFVCACGKKQPHNKVTFCEKCEVEYIDQRSRRYRLGYISLLSPVTHIWYLKGRPSYLSLFLGKRKKSVVSLAYCNAYLIEHIPFQKEDERQVWPFIPSLFKTGNLLQNNLSKYKPNRLLTGSARTSNLSKYLPGYVNWSWAQKTKSPTQEYARTRKQTIFANKFDLQVGDLHSLAYTEHSARKIFSRPLQPRTLLCPKNTRAVRTQLGLNGLCKSRIYVNSSKRLFTPIAIQHKSKICEVPLLAPKEHGNRSKKGHVCIKTKSPDLNTLDASFRRNDRSFLQNYANSFAGMQKETCKAVSRFCVTSSKRKVKWVSHARTCNLCTNLRTRLSTLRACVDLSPAVIECKYSGLCSKGTERVRFVKCSKDSLTRVRLAQPLRKSSVLNCEGINVIVDHTNPWHVLCRATQLEDLCCTAYKPKVCRARRVTSQIEDLCCTVKKAFGKHFAPSQQTVTMSNRRLALSQRCICRSTNSLRIRNTDNFYTESYAKYSYTRQQCLPFLPSFASHFYLRDALLNFIYSAPASDDIPLSEYCKTSRVEPLQDVHKFMARQTVERLKGVGSLTFATSPPAEGHTNLRFASVEDAKIKNFHTSSLPCSCIQGPCSCPSLLRRSMAIGARARRCNFLLRKSMAIVARRGLQTEGLYVHLLDLAPKEHGHSNTRFWCKKAIRDSQKFVRGLPEFDLKTYVLRNLKGDSHKSICKTYCKSKQTRFDFAPSMSLGTKVKNTPRLRRFVWRTYKPKVCTCKTHRHTSECNQLLRKKSQAYVKNIQQSTLTKTKNLINQTLNEDNNTALSNLELTAIREILSYTGGGALQHLLKQFDPHDLCKFLVAEKQILRVLYQNHIASLVSFESDTQKSQILTRPLSPSVNDPFLNDAKAKAISPLLGLQNGLCQTLLTPLKKHNITCRVKTFCAPGYSCIKDATTFTSFTSQIEDLLTMQIEPKLSKPLDNIDTARQVQDSARLSKNKVLYAQYTGNPLGLPWQLKSKTKQLYQKKEIVRISRRIYKVVRRLKVAQLLTLNHRRPEWMILSHLPVLPPDLRPILQMSEKVIVASDLNIMYQRVIYRNNRHLRVRFIDFQLVTAIQRLVQDAVDRLMENGKGGSKPYYTQGGRPLKSLSDILKGKKGRFRLNLLGKRVDFSGRSVIVVAPSLKIHECGLPKDIALELYHYFLLRQLIVKKYCTSIVTAKKMIKSKSSQMWDILREVMYHHPVLLNRAPTLHRLGIQAFQPKLVVGNAIWLHPLVCSGFNADFDGDQMGVHLPLSFAARSESWDLLWSRNNLLSPATGQPMLVPSQDMVLGFYYMTAQGFANRFMNGIKSKTDYLKIGDTANRNARTFCTSSHSTILKSSSRLNLRARTCLTPIVPIDMPYSCPYSFGARAIGVRRGMPIGAKKGAAIGTNNSFVFVNTTAIITNFQNGNIRLHTPVWLNWAGEIENENTSATPFELRVHGLGSQRYIYENLISSDLFTNTNSLYTDCSEDTRTLNQRSVHDSCVPKQIAQGRTRAFTKISFIRGGRAKLGTHLTTNTLPPFALKTHDNKVEASKACTQIEGLQSTSHKSLAPGFPLQNDTTSEKSKIDASFICTQPKASYVRTTAGRVLMNNILKA